MVQRFRYPGGGFSFCQGDENIFFGRQNAIDYIYNCVLLNQCVVVYGKSAVGKSSLLQAGVIPKILRTVNDQKLNQDNFRIYSVRTGIWQPTDLSQLIEKIKNLKLHKGGSTPGKEAFLDFLPEDIRNTLWYKFKALQFNAIRDSNKDTYVLVIDQVEELFTYPADQLSAMVYELADLRSQILPDKVRNAVEKFERGGGTLLTSMENEVLYNAVPVKFIFSIRSDKLYLIGRLRKAIPAIFQNTFELFPFSRDQALDAIIKPSIGKGRFTSKVFDLSQVTDKILEFLLKEQNSELEYNADNSRIEPFALQIICRHIEQKLVIRENIAAVTPEMLGDLNTILLNFYLDTIKDLALDALSELKVRQLIEEKMIYDLDRRRISVYINIIINELGIDRKVFRQLVDSRIIRESSSGSLSFEISHDTLITPILHAKQARIQLENELNKKYDSGSRDIIKEMNIQTLDFEMKKNPYDYKLFQAKAQHLYSSQNYSEALEYYDKAMELCKSFDRDLTIGAANCQYNLGAFQKSNDLLLKVIRVDPENIYALYYIGFNYQRLEKYADAITYYQKALVIKPSHKEVNYNLGIVYMKTGQLPEAAECFKKMIELYPDEAASYLLIIDVFIQLNKPQQTEHFVSKFMNLHPDAAAYGKIANLYLQSGDSSKALDYYLKAIRQEPRNASFHANAGIILSNLGQVKQAIRHLELACKFQKQNAFYFTWLGFLYQRIGLNNKAIIRFAKAVKFDPTYRYARAALAASYRRIGDNAAYQAHIREAVKLPASVSEDDYSSASFEALCGHNELALDYLAKAMDKGLRSADFALLDPDFDFIRDTPQFIALVSKANTDDLK